MRDNPRGNKIFYNLWPLEIIFDPDAWRMVHENQNWRAYGVLLRVIADKYPFSAELEFLVYCGMFSFYFI